MTTDSSFRVHYPKKQSATAPQMGLSWEAPQKELLSQWENERERERERERDAWEAVTLAATTAALLRPPPSRANSLIGWPIRFCPIWQASCLMGSLGHSLAGPNPPVGQALSARHQEVRRAGLSEAVWGLLEAGVSTRETERGRFFIPLEYSCIGMRSSSRVGQPQWMGCPWYCFFVWWGK